MSDLKDLPLTMRELAAREAELQAQAEEKKRAQERAADSQREMTEAAGLSRAREIISGLAPLYAERAGIARELAPGLAELWKIDSEIKRRENETRELLRASRRFADTPGPDESLQTLRALAHLPPTADPGLPQPANPAELLAATALWAIFAHVITPGQIILGSRSMAVSFKDGNR